MTIFGTLITWSLTAGGRSSKGLLKTGTTVHVKTSLVLQLGPHMPGMRDSVGVLVRGRDLVECASVSVGRARLGANCALHLVHVFLTRRVSGRQIEGAGSDNGSRRETHQGSVFHLSHARTRAFQPDLIDSVM